MQARTRIFSLLLVLLLVISTSAQAMVMPPLPQSNHDMPMMMDMEGHCANNADQSQSSCQHDHCSMCMIGVLGPGMLHLLPSRQPTLPEVSLLDSEQQPNKLFRPPKL